MIVEKKWSTGIAVQDEDVINLYQPEHMDIAQWSDDYDNIIADEGENEDSAEDLFWWCS